MYGYIYKTTNIKNNKVYIGKHKGSIHNPKYLGSGTLLKQAIKKYGRENFSNEVIEFCKTSEELIKREIFWIKLYRKNHDVYNILDGGEGVSPEIAKKTAIERWRKTPTEIRIKHMDKARLVQKQLREMGQYTVKRCIECNNTPNSHKKGCSFKKEINYKRCSECNAKQEHFKHCSKFVSKKRTQETRKKLSLIAKNRSKEHNDKIASTLKTAWKNGDFDYLTCKICFGKSSNHKKDCPLAKTCPECGGKNVSHKKNCSKFKPIPKYVCEYCSKEIAGIGNLRQHVNKIHKLNK